MEKVTSVKTEPCLKKGAERRESQITRGSRGLIVAQSHIKVQDLFDKRNKNLFSKLDFQISDEQAAAGSGHWSRPSCSGRRFVKVKHKILIV